MSRKPPLLLAAALLLVGCSPRNGFAPPVGDDDDVDIGGTCEADTSANAWPELLPEYESYEGEGANTGQLLPNFQLTDQNGQEMCFSQLLGHVLIVDASTIWCGPCNEAAAESAALWEEMEQIGPTFITTLIVQNAFAQPAALSDIEWWVDQYDIEYPVVLDESEQTAALWGVTDYPLFLFVAPTGEIHERQESKPSETDVLDFVEFAVEEWADDLRP
jgi:peroxiredoxin